MIERPDRIHCTARTNDKVKRLIGLLLGKQLLHLSLVELFPVLPQCLAHDLVPLVGVESSHGDLLLMALSG